MADFLNEQAPFSVDLAQAEMSEQEVVRYSLAERVAFLVDNQKAVDLVDSIRWKSGHFCPRCNSRFVKRVNTNVFRDLHRCIDCGYMFNSLSGTIFQGSKIQIVRFFQLLALENALKDDLGIREVCFAIDVSHKTAVSLVRRIRSVQPKIDFAVRSKPVHNRLRQSGVEVQPDTSNTYRNFLAYCEMNSIVIQEESFPEYLSSFL